MKITATPCSFSVPMIENRISVSREVSEEVGSSIMTTFASTLTALAISTICWRAMLSSPTGLLTSPSMPSRRKSACASSNIFFHWTMPRALGCRPRKMFSATVRLPIRLSSWWMIEIPSLSAAFGVPISTSRPLKRMVPPSFL